MNNIIKTSIKTENIKKLLPYGSLSEIARKSNTSIHTVIRVINGKSKNKKATKALSKLIVELAATKEQIENGLESLAN